MSETIARGGASWEGPYGTRTGYPHFINDQIVPSNNVLPTVDYFGTEPLRNAAEGIGADGVRVARAMNPGTYFGAPQPNLDRHLREAPSFTGDMMHGLKYLATTPPWESIPEIASSVSPNTEGGFWNLLGLGAGGYGAGRGLAHAGRVGRQRWNQFGDDLHGAADAAGGWNIPARQTPRPWNQSRNPYAPMTHWTREWAPGMTAPQGYMSGMSHGPTDWNRVNFQTTPSIPWTNRLPDADWQRAVMPDYQTPFPTLDNPPTGFGRYTGLGVTPNVMPKAPPSYFGETRFQGEGPAPVTPAVWAEMNAQRILEEHDPFFTPEGSGMRVFDPNSPTTPLDVSAAVPVVTQFDDLFRSPDQRGLTPQQQAAKAAEWESGIDPSDPLKSRRDLRGSFRSEPEPPSNVSPKQKQIQDAEIRLREQQAAEAGLPPLHGPGYEIEVPVVPPSQWELFKRHQEAKKAEADANPDPDPFFGGALTPEEIQNTIPGELWDPSVRGGPIRSDYTSQAAYLKALDEWAEFQEWKSGIDPSNPMASVPQGGRGSAYRQYLRDTAGYEARGGGKQPRLSFEEWLDSPMGNPKTYERFPAMHPSGWPNKVQPIPRQHPSR